MQDSTPDAVGPIQQAFYEINKAQHFEFPHIDCDTYTDDQLARLYFKQSGFGEYCCRVVSKYTSDACMDLNILQQNPQFVNCVVAWMRLKFIAELVDPVRYAHYFHIRPRPHPSKPLRLPAELLALYDTDTTEFFAYVDNLANQIQLRWIQMLAFACGNMPAHPLDDLCIHLNSELQTIRSRIVPPYTLDGVDPYDLALYPFLTFHLELRRVLLSRPAP
jgi:hypothetical protein